MTNAAAIGSNATVSADNSMVLGSITGLGSIAGVSGDTRVGIGATNGLAKLTVKGSPQFTASGTISITGGTGAVTGVGTRFLSEVAVGDRITANSTGENRAVFAIASDTSMTVSTFTNTVSGSNFIDQPSFFRVDDSAGNVRFIVRNSGNVGINMNNPNNTLAVGGTIYANNRTFIGPISNPSPSLLSVRGINFGAIGGTVTVTAGSTAVTGVNTGFTSFVGVGDRIKIGVSNEIRTVVAVASDTSLTVDSNFSTAESGVTLTPLASLFRADDSSANPKVLISDTGNLGLGTLTPTQTLDVVGNANVSGCFMIGGSGIAGTCSSDLRLKKNIQPFSSVLDKVVQLQPVHYDWRANEFPEYHFGASRATGLIAQEVEKVFPDMVSTDANGYKQVNYSQLPYLMLQAIRELKTENDALRDQLKAQEQAQQIKETEWEERLQHLESALLGRTNRATLQKAEQ